MDAGRLFACAALAGAAIGCGTSAAPPGTLDSAPLSSAASGPRPDAEPAPRSGIPAHLPAIVRDAEGFTPVETEWCGEGWIGLDAHTCFAAPEGLGSPATIVFFLHGMLAPDARPSAEQETVRRFAIERGAVAVSPSGMPGLCAWDRSFLEWTCWPSARKTVDGSGASFFAEWAGEEARIAKLLGVSFDRRALVGFSNGGYFAAYVGLEGLFPLDGVAVVGAGRSRIEPRRVAPRPVPFYVAVGDEDLDGTKLGAESLAFALDQRRWPYAYVTHAGRGHGIADDDLEAAWETWFGR